jgi:hypothetical protein
MTVGDYVVSTSMDSSKKRGVIIDFAYGRHKDMAAWEEIFTILWDDGIVANVGETFLDVIFGGTHRRQETA